jgi:hypothetical protein
MIDIDTVVRDDLERQVQQTVGCRVVSWSVLAGGGNNRLYRLETDGPPLVAKVYRRSVWLDELFGRGGAALTREFGVLSLLQQRGIRGVPRPYVRSDACGYAVYSYEPGEVRRPSDLGSDEVRALATFAAELHGFSSDEAGGDLPAALDASFSLAEQIATIRGRLRWPCPPAAPATANAGAGAADPAGRRALGDRRRLGMGRLGRCGEAGHGVRRPRRL